MDIRRTTSWTWCWLTGMVMLAIAMLIASGMLSGCENGNGGNDSVSTTGSNGQGGAVREPSPADGEASSDETVNVRMESSADNDESIPSVRVTGDEATIDLGEVPTRSRHRVAFDIVNSTSKDIDIKTVRSDCTCIEVVERSDTLRAGKTTRILAVYESPKQAIPYATQLTVVTDSKERPFIRLWVKSRPADR